MTQEIAKQESTSAIAEMQRRMNDQGIVLSAKTQKMVHDLKNLDRHFYSVGKFKGADGQWQDKLEPDAFAVQTMATVQSINTEVVSTEWENADDLLKAAVTVRVRGWKGRKEKPDIEKTIQLRLSMHAIMSKYVMDKLSPKTKWNNDSRRKEQTAAEWSEEDVVMLDNGWIEPKSFAHKVAMRSYLTDQYNFLDRTAESKAERRLNLKLLGFDWREPEEITEQNAEAATVQKQERVDPAPLLEQILKCDRAGMAALAQELAGVMAKLTDEDRKLVQDAMKKKREEWDAKEQPAKEEPAETTEGPAEQTAIPTDADIEASEREGMKSA